MIHADEGRCVIKGHRVDIAIEYTHITEQMLKMSPDIVIAVISNFSDDIDKVIPSIDSYDIKVANDIVKIFKGSMEGR